MSNHRRRLGWGGLALCLCWCLGAAELEAQTLSYRLKWLFNTSVVGDLWAEAHGAFAAAGLQVEVKAGGPERDAIKELELGQAQFGVASADQVIRALSKGAPVVVLAQLFQVNPLQWIYRADAAPIEDLQALRGLTIGVTFGGNDETILRTLLDKAGLAESDVRLFSVRYDYTPFYRREVDIWPVYRNAQGPIIARKLASAGEGVRYFNPADHGVAFVANSVVTSARMVQEEPATVKAFIRALLAAWDEALDPARAAEAVALIRRFDPDSTAELVGEQLESTRALVRPTADIRIGAIDAAAWRQTEAIMRAQNQIPAPVGVDRVLRPEFAFGD